MSKPPTGAARAEIQKELAKARSGLRSWSKKVNERQMEFLDAPRERKEETRAHLSQAKQRESELLSTITDFEMTLFGDWMPKKPPDPERSLEIARAAGLVKGEG